MSPAALIAVTRGARAARSAPERMMRRDEPQRRAVIGGLCDCP